MNPTTGDAGKGKTIILHSTQEDAVIRVNVPDTLDNADLCLCQSCPTRNECIKQQEQRLFCARGKTDCNLVRKGCFCGACPLENVYQFPGLYFCELGAVQ